MKKILTLIFPLYKPTELEIENIIYTNKKIMNEVDILVLSDNEDIDKKYYSIFENEKIKYIKSQGNIGKYQVVKNAVDNNLVKTKWFKICDSDDIVKLKSISNFNKRFSRFRKDKVIRFYPSLNIKPGSWSTKEVNENIDKIKIKKRRMFSIVNENTIHPTSHLKKSPIIAPNQTKSSDVLFSLASCINRKLRVKNWNDSFYIYNKHSGISSQDTFNETMFMQLISFLEIMKDYEEQNNMKAPSYFDYRWAHNNIIKSEWSIEDKIEKMRYIFDLLSVAAKDNWNWNAKWDEESWEKFKDKLIAGEEIK